MGDHGYRIANEGHKIVGYAWWRGDAEEIVDSHNRLLQERHDYPFRSREEWLHYRSDLDVESARRNLDAH